MKIYTIGKWSFWGIALLILALPVSRHWRLLVTGKRAPGTVMQYSRLWHEHWNGESTIAYASEVLFQVEGEPVVTHGPLNFQYEPGRELNVVYNPKDPSRNCIMTFSGLYLTNYTALPVILFVLWGAFYLSFNTLTKKYR